MSKGDTMARSTPENTGDYLAQRTARMDARVKKAYTAKRVEVLSKMSCLNDALNHHGEHQVTWGGVGDLGHVNEQLSEILAFLRA